MGSLGLWKLHKVYYYYYYYYYQNLLIEERKNNSYSNDGPVKNGMLVSILCHKSMTTILNDWILQGKKTCKYVCGEITFSEFNHFDTLCSLYMSG